MQVRRGTRPPARQAVQPPQVGLGGPGEGQGRGPGPVSAPRPVQRNCFLEGSSTPRGDILSLTCSSV